MGVVVEMRTLKEEEKRVEWSIEALEMEIIYKTFSCLTDRIRLNVLIISFYILHIIG